MKKIFIGFLIILCLAGINNNVFAVVVTSQNLYNSKTAKNNLSFGKYLEFYSIDYKDINMNFIELPSEKERKFLSTLNSEEKENYKYVKKIQKLISKGNWGEVLYKYPDYFPAYVQYYSYCMNQKNYSEALRILIQIQNMDKYAQVFDENLVNYSLGTLYYNTGNYSKALEYFRAYESSGKDYIYSSIANCYFYLGNYKSAIDYKKKMSNIAYIDKELIYDSYLKLNDKVSANEIAKELLKEKYGFTNLMRLEKTSSDDEKKLAYAYTARNTAATDNQIVEVNNIIADLEQKKLDKKLSLIKGFVKAPRWLDMKKQFPQNVTPNEMSAKQDEFFNLANQYITTYKGQDLVNALNSLNQDFNNYIQIKQNQYRQEQEIEAQTAILLEQQRQNNYLRQQILRQQKLRYYMDMDRMYYMRNSSYYMMPGYDLWW